MLTRANSTTATGNGNAVPSSSSAAVTPTSRFGSHFGYLGGYNDALDTEHSSLDEEEDAVAEGEEEDQVWGLEKGMELFEVSAKDETGKRNNQTI